MKKFVGSLFVALFAAAFAYQLSRKAPDVRYTLSERIPVTFSTSDDELPAESVQRLEVRNVGNDEAREVQVKLNARVTWHKLLKHSETSAPVVFANRVPFELVYPSLPPEASIVVIFRSTGSVQNTAVSVHHSAGRATEALARTGTSWGSWIMWFAILVNLFASVLTVFTDQRSRADRRLAYKKLSDVLGAKKPLLVNDGTWRSSLRAALVKLVEQPSDTVEALKRSDASLILNLAQPPQVDAILWAEVQAAASRTYERSFKQLIKAPLSSVQSLYTLQKPAGVSQAVWRDLQDDVRKRHVAEITPRAWDQTAIRLLLRAAPPELEGTDEWTKLHQHLQDEHSRLLAERFIYDRSAFSS